MNDYSCVPGMFIIPGEPEIVTETRARILWAFQDLQFDEGPHIYTLHGVKLPSVTTILNKYMIPFDTEQQAILYAQRHGGTPEYWKEQWKYNNKISTTTGTLVHEFGESMAYVRNNLPDHITDSCKSKYLPGENWLIPTRPKEEAIVKFWNEIPPCFHFVLAEAKLFTNSGKIGKLKQQLAGTSDIIMYYDGQGNIDKSGIAIWDYKGLPLDTDIPSPLGFIKMRDIKPGDIVYSGTGNTCKVVHVSEIHHNPCYHISFTNGTMYTADKDHRWVVNENHEVKTTEQLSGSDRIYHCLGIKGEHVDGLPDFSKIQETTYDPDIDFPLIPREYLRADPEQRSYILRNIIKVYGQHVVLNQFYVFIKSKSGSLSNKNFLERFDRFIELLGTFGIRYREVRTTNLFETGEVIFRIWFDIDQKYSGICRVCKTKTVDTKCIEVDSPDHTYCFGKEFIVTHNTNKSITNAFARSRKEFMLPPFDKFINEPQGEYTAQLSLYQIPLEDIGLKVIDRRLIWLKQDGTYEKIPTPDITRIIRDTL